MKSTFSNRRRIPAVLAGAAAIAVLAACAPAADKPADSGASGAASGSTATGKPFRIGWASMDKGQIPLPGLTDGALAATAYVNAHGGINGRPIELVTCSVDSTPETNQQCGQQFANDKTLNMAMMGISVGAGPYYAALQSTGLPVLGISPVTPADFEAPANVRFYYSGGAGTYTGLAKIASVVKPKTIAYLQLDNPGGQAGLAQFKEAAKDLGATITSVAVSQTATDVLPQLVQAGAGNADFIVVGVPNCLPVAKALKTLGAKGKVASVGSCFSTKTIQSDPTLFEGWYDPAYVRSALEGNGVDQVMDTFLTEYPKYAKLATTPIATNAEAGWAGILSLKAALEGATDATLDDKGALLEKLKAFKGPATLGASTLDCSGSVKGYSSTCTLDIVIEKVQNGKLVPQL